ncbi:hypothetical protein M9H77_17477 [Catharanthus roseus]|uniref:Uncharacterized protein n=1 Tax=Catharanthus roseus TaxID=4058 RepID=A0ACC0B4Q2_CATRO|nr:hypothetical protein M9H77_17477 [Catharanthus roseus]
MGHRQSNALFSSIPYYYYMTRLDKTHLRLDPILNSSRSHLLVILAFLFVALLADTLDSAELEEEPLLDLDVTRTPIDNSKIINCSLFSPILADDPKLKTSKKLPKEGDAFDVKRMKSRRHIQKG